MNFCEIFNFSILKILNLSGIPWGGGALLLGIGCIYPPQYLRFLSGGATSIHLNGAISCNFSFNFCMCSNSLIVQFSFWRFRVAISPKLLNPWKCLVFLFSININFRRFCFEKITIIIEKTVANLIKSWKIGKLKIAWNFSKNKIN